MLHPKIVLKLREIESRLRETGRLPTTLQLQQYYANFRDHFGPEELQSLDGEALLVRMHGLDRNNRNTLIYWLEFKDDEEFPFVFGSISGGSALKYGLYSSSATGQWMARGEGHKPVQISLEQAIAIARRNREQLLNGCERLAQLPSNASDADYLQLQRDMAHLAPDVYDTAWGHKYFSVLFPDKLDNYHNEAYQRFHLVRLLLEPPDAAGRFVAAGRYLQVAHALEMPLIHLTTILNEYTPRLYSYWQLRCRAIDGISGEQACQIMQDKSCLALGWGELGDLSEIMHDRKDRQWLGGQLKRIGAYTNHAQSAIFAFVTDLAAPDLVAVTVGSQVAGIAKVVGPYYYEAGTKLPHRRPVNWLSLAEWPPTENGSRDAILSRPKTFLMQVEIERRVLEVPPELDGSDAGVPQPTLPVAQLDGVLGAIQAILERKGQVILYGPPGTGKTHWAEVAATELAARHAFGRRFEDLTAEDRVRVFGGSDSLVRLCSFHPAYGYEDFLEGYRPTEVNGHLQFALRDGIFKQLCVQAASQPKHNFYLIIDEINRGDIPRIFGELLTLLEKNKREKSVILPLSGNPFMVPKNLCILGTMNTADRSIALLDAALRRRFGFLQLMPEPELLANTFVHGLPLAAWLRELNKRILIHVGRDARNLQIGHAYLLDRGQPIADFAHFARVLREDLIPLLEEYCYEDYARLEQILGAGLVDVAAQQLRTGLFAPGSENDLIRALLQPTPDLATAVQDYDTDLDSDGGETDDGEENDVESQA
jgi:5-methylcytosine-specific restriction protein B